jgi:hypothetical protein
MALCPAGSAPLRAVIRPWIALWVLSVALGAEGCRPERSTILTRSKEYLSLGPNQALGVTSGTTPPRCVSRVDAKVPESCRELNEQETFVWEAAVSETGTVESVRLLKAPVLAPRCPGLEAELRKGILGSKYEVTTIDGRPTRVVVTIEQSVTAQ